MEKIEIADVKRIERDMTNLENAGYGGTVYRVTDYALELINTVQLSVDRPLLQKNIVAWKSVNPSLHPIVVLSDGTIDTIPPNLSSSLKHYKYYNKKRQYA